MTDEELKKLVSDLAVSQKKTDEQMKRTDEQMKKTDEKLNRVSGLLGNIGNNNGDFAEEYFYSALSNNLQLGSLKFDSIDKNVSRRTKNLTDEFDIILTNSNILVVAEVKYKFHKADVEKLKEKKIPNFRSLFPKYKSYKIYGAIAGLSLPKETIETARNYGFFILSQHNDKLEIVNKKVIAY